NQIDLPPRKAYTKHLKNTVSENESENRVTHQNNINHINDADSADTANIPNCTTTDIIKLTDEFKNALKKRLVNIIENLWKNPFLNQWTKGQLIKLRDSNTPQCISDAEHISLFKAALSSDHQIIMTDLLTNKLKEIIENLDSADSLNILERVCNIN